MMGDALLTPLLELILGQNSDSVCVVRVIFSEHVADLDILHFAHLHVAKRKC